MRDTNSWRRELRRSLRKHLSEIEANLTFTKFCDIELGLYLLSELIPTARADSLWVLLTGYPFPITESHYWSEQQWRMLGNARHILSQFRSDYNWTNGLEHYCLIDERLRGYEIDADFNQFSQRAVSIASNRYQIYANTLNVPLQYRQDPVRWITEAGLYECTDGKYPATVDITPELILDPPASHNLTGRNERNEITVSKEELVETARWMDSVLHPELAASQDESQQTQTWEYRISRVSLELFTENSMALTDADSLTINGLMHLIGMVSSGKSTLMDVLAVWAAQQKLHITLVVGDVIGALERAKLFHKLGIKVAPILGVSNRERHTNRLHRVWNSEHPLEPFAQEHQGFQWLSTACPLSELRRDVTQPIVSGQQPCLSLLRLDNAEEEEQAQTSKTYACPIYSACPFHQAQRDLVKAQIWIATPASLVYTRVAKQINTESIRFIELVSRRSDLIVVDEVDQVQVQLDNIFSPNQKLFGPGGNGWFSQVQQPVVRQLNLEGRGQLADPDIDRWELAHDTTQTAISRIYSLMLNPKAETALKVWKKKGESFTDWLILDKLAVKLSGTQLNQRNTNPDYRRLMDLFEAYLNDPLGDRSNHQLSEFTRQLITLTNEELVLQRLQAWILENKAPAVTLTEPELKDAVIQLKFALLVAAVQERLNRMLRDWKLVEETFKLEGESSLLVHNPPRDYEAVIPVAPMGNILAFQYVSYNDNEPGNLCFFKCLGIGRWLLLHLHELFASDCIVGPNVLLLSGTSWAGDAPGYHLQVPVAGILRSPLEELQAIEKSDFRFEPFYYDETQQPITVSGKSGHERVIALKELLNKLTQPSGLGGPSLLEVERDALPEGRQRILLLVGSYEEAKLTQEHLEHIRPEWRDQILRLVCDDDEFESEWRSSSGRSIQRGLVSKFATTGAWILIAPLMAIERGHNILNDTGKAAFGAAYFLVRPLPRPDDISYAIHSINRWAVEKYNNISWLTSKCEDNLLTLDNAGKAFRKAAYSEWRRLLRLPMIYSTLGNDERKAVTWNQLVSIWQVIGRLVRGGSPARVVFCDAAFARRTAYQDELGEVPLTSLLVSIKQVLHPYFLPNSHSEITARDQALVQALYGPFYQAIENMGGIAD